MSYGRKINNEKLQQINTERIHNFPDPVGNEILKYLHDERVMTS